jgi:hypothetical protein
MLEEDGSQTRALTLFVALAHVDQDRFVLPSEAAGEAVAIPVVADPVRVKVFPGMFVLLWPCR